MITVKINKVDSVLIQRLATILELFFCHLAIDPDKFRIYIQERPNLVIFLYAWYKLPPTVGRQFYQLIIRQQGLQMLQDSSL